MPELPEVETIARAVSKSLKGAKLVGSNFFRADIRDPIPTESIRSNLHGQRVRGVTRRSKYLLIDTDGGSGLFHLGMSGVIDISQSASPQKKHTHAIFHFHREDGEDLYLHFIDPRRFGRIGFVAPGKTARDKEFEDLGVEPLELSLNLGDYLWKESRRKSTAVKNFVMDQRVVVGVGNIYAAESLFRAGLSPMTAASKITKKSYDKLGLVIRETLQDAIRQGGTSFRDFRHVDGTQGYFEVHLNVYGRTDAPCHKCGTGIKQLRQAGRSTFYCPRCQKA